MFKLRNSIFILSIITITHFLQLLKIQVSNADLYASVIKLVSVFDVSCDIHAMHTDDNDNFLLYLGNSMRSGIQNWF